MLTLCLQEILSANYTRIHKNSAYLIKTIYFYGTELITNSLKPSDTVINFL